MAGKKLTLGSLFDGSGGFPLGGLLAGIEPVWASEIEPFRVLVTHKRLPQRREPERLWQPITNRRRL
jgi:DNA (cytosine-5)-methyltransferase 1